MLVNSVSRVGKRFTKSNIVGPVAQLGERLICIQEVIGSIPFRSIVGWLAQLVEHLLYTQAVGGSSPSLPISIKEVI